MKGRSRLPALILIGLCCCLQGCRSHADRVTSLSGRTMGTTYQISFPQAEAPSAPLQPHIDALLQEINASLSTYIDTSAISLFNAMPDTAVVFPIDTHFATVFERASEIYSHTGGAFNPALGPLVNAWGFGPDEAQTLSQRQVDSLKVLADFSAFYFEAAANTLKKNMPGAQLNFSAIAKGYGVDAVSELLAASGISDYFVEIGGEVRANGQHPAGRPWRLGIDAPSAAELETRVIQSVIEFTNSAIATSGNYRNFYIKDGRKYVHIINPFTGYPEESDLLSASVQALDCMTADAYATAFMVIGKDRALTLAESLEDVEAYFIVSDSAGHLVEIRTSGFPAAVEMGG